MLAFCPCGRITDRRTFQNPKKLCKRRGKILESQKRSKYNKDKKSKIVKVKCLLMLDLRGYEKCCVKNVNKRMQIYIWP